VLGRENEDSAGAFAADHPGFRPVPIEQALDSPNLTHAGRERLAELACGGHTLQLTPRRTNTDGFFIALFERVA
jgi:16S rRNA (cytosine967-C5)-methyltransferase